MTIKDIFAEGIAEGWKVYSGAKLDKDTTFEADVAIIGTGAGGGTSAEILAKRGLKVLLIEEGGLRTSNDFNMDEKTAYSEMYQEGATRATKDKAISILQGRAVGGTTVVNWTSCFRTPEPTLNHWAEHHKVTGSSAAEMAPWFELMEKRLNVETWQLPPNANNVGLKNGCQTLGYHWGVIPRNVKGCWNLGYCGVGCPTNAKQSMLVTTIPGALKENAELLYLARAERLHFKGDKVAELECVALDNDLVTARPIKIRVKAKHFVLSGGSINSPAVLLRSEAPDPFELLGKRTFLHPTVLTMGRMKEKVDGFYGAPQSIYSDEFQWKNKQGPMGFKLESMPLQPMLASTNFRQMGAALNESMSQLAYCQAQLAMMRDGFSDQSQGGEVQLRDDGSPVLDYAISDEMWDGIKRAYLAMAEIQFASGAQSVYFTHSDSGWVNSWQEAQAAIEQLSLQKYRAGIGSAHVMGGCKMGDDPASSVVNSVGEHHQLKNLSVIDGSVFPTSIGANPQLSVYAFSSKFATHLADKLCGEGDCVRVVNG